VRVLNRLDHVLDHLLRIAEHHHGFILVKELVSKVKDLVLRLQKNLKDQICSGLAAFRKLGSVMDENHQHI
jgi:hypothetical protein